MPHNIHWYHICRMNVNEHVMSWHLEFHPKVEINVGRVFTLASKNHPFWFQLIRIEPKQELQHVLKQELEPNFIF